MVTRLSPGMIGSRNLWSIFCQVDRSQHEIRTSTIARILKLGILANLQVSCISFHTTVALLHNMCAVMTECGRAL